MRSRVVIFQRREDGELSAWDEAEEQAFSCNSEGSGERRWEDLSATLAGLWTARSHKEIFVCICLVGGELVEERDRSALVDLLRKARRSTWGARILLVLSRLARIVHYKKAIGEWLAAAERGEVLDLVEADYDNRDPESIHLDRLQEAVARAMRRQKVFGAAPAPGVWHCILPLERRGRLGALLAPYVHYGNAEPLQEGVGLVAVLKTADPAGQVQSLAEICGMYGDRRYLAVCLQPASDELRSDCIRRRMPLPIEVAGEYELCFLVLRLNGARDAALPTTWPIPLAVREPPRLRAPRPAARPALLLTSSLDPKKSMECAAVGATFAGVMAGAPRCLHYQFDPSFDACRWWAAVQGLRRPAIWVHLAPDSGWPEAAGPAAPPDLPQGWLEGLTPGSSALSLALLCSSASADLARKLAQAGAGVGIGFAGTVRATDWTGAVRAIVRAALSQGAGRESILSAYTAALGQLDQPALEAEPRAYYACRL